MSANASDSGSINPIVSVPAAWVWVKGGIRAIPSITQKLFLLILIRTSLCRGGVPNKAELCRPASFGL